MPDLHEALGPDVLEEPTEKLTGVVVRRRALPTFR
jgi:hypothetical protein